VTADLAVGKHLVRVQHGRAIGSELAMVGVEGIVDDGHRHAGPVIAPNVLDIVRTPNLASLIGVTTDFGRRSRLGEDHFVEIEDRPELVGRQRKLEERGP